MRVSQLIEDYGDEALYTSAGITYISFVYAIFSMEKPLVTESLQHLKRSIDNCNIRRRNHQGLSSWLFKPNYNNYSDVDAHAEVIYGEAHFMTVLVTFIDDPSILTIIKTVLKLRTAYNSYKLCGEILEKKDNWLSPELKEHFEVAYKLGWGLYNIVMSHLPTRVLSILSFVGFTSDRSLGLRYLHELTETKNHIYRSKLAGFMMCFYTFYLEQFFGCGAGDLDWVQSITSRALSQSPDSAFDLFWAARYEQLAGNADRAIQLFLRSKNAQSEITSLKNVCTWDLLWSYAIKCDWRSASECALELSEKCDWSKATNLYQWACFQYMIMEEEKDPSILPAIEDALRSLPSLRRRFIGKTLPPEKFAISKAEKYFEDKTMTLPALELFYVWNIFGLCAKNKDVLGPLMKRIEKKLEQPEYSRDSGNGEHWVLVLLKGVCLKNYGQFAEAIDCFNDILKNESVIGKAHAYVPPQAALEIGLTYLAIDNVDDSKRWLERARDQYTGFLIESLVHLRIHGALGRIDEIKDRNKRIAKAKKIDLSMNNNASQVIS